jgi:hypothetical protein
MAQKARGNCARAVPQCSANVNVLFQKGLVCLEGENDLSVRVLHGLEEKIAFLVLLSGLGWGSRRVDVGAWGGSMLIG